MARLIITTPGESVDIGGDVDVVGLSTGGETVIVTRGEISFDASYSQGGDEIVLPGSAGDYTARLEGSRVIITDGTTSISVPVGPQGIDITFDDGDDTRTLVFDPQSGDVTLGDQVIDTDETPLQPGGVIIGTDDDDTFEDLGDEGVTVFAGAGDDTIIGGAGDDSLFGEAGDDTIEGNGGNDLLDGGAGNDDLDGGAGNDTLNGGAGNDTLTGGAGFDRAVFGTGSLTPVNVDLRITTAQNTGRGTDTLSGIEAVSGDIGSDTLIGDDNANWLWGVAGDDLLQGNGGNDLLQTGHGVQVVDGGSGNDVFGYVSTNGSPTTGANISLAVAEGASQNTGWGALRLTGIESLHGTQFDDILTGDEGPNILAGGAGDDELNGGDGDDILLGDGMFMVDMESAVGGIVRVDNLEGVAGDDILRGGNGNDLLIGGGGSDLMTGGAGADTFKYLAESDSTVEDPDVIDDFVAGTDKIDLSAIDADPDTAGNQTFAFVAEFTGDAGQVTTTYDTGTNRTLVLVDIDGDMNADMRIDLIGNIGVTAADFVL